MLRYEGQVMGTTTVQCDCKVGIPGRQRNFKKKITPTPSRKNPKKNETGATHLGHHVQLLALDEVLLE
jgi:hypothetical protein